MLDIISVDYSALKLLAFLANSYVTTDKACLRPGAPNGLRSFSGDIATKM